MNYIKKIINKIKQLYINIFKKNTSNYEIFNEIEQTFDEIDKIFNEDISSDKIEHIHEEPTEKNTLTDPVENKFNDFLTFDEFNQIDEPVAKDITYEFGTIIIAARYHSNNEKHFINEGHRYGPFIVLEDDGKKLICIGGTGTEASLYIKEHRYIKVDSKDYNLKKDTYFYATYLSEIKYDSIKYIINTLNEEDKNILLKKIEILKNENYYKYHLIKTEKPKIKVGDIVEYKTTNYLIIDENDHFYIALLLQESKEKKEDSILINNKYYKFISSNIREINKNSELKFKNFTNKETFTILLKKYQKYLNHKTNQTIKQRGSLLKINDDYYYIYGEFADKWLVFKIVTIPIEDYTQISINNKYYYTNFQKKLEIDKKDSNTECISLATNKEIEEITQARKHYKIIVPTPSKTLKRNNK